MKCDICKKSQALNFYGIAITDRGTFVTSARWGQNITAARNRARDAAKDFVWPNDFLYDIKTVVAHNRQEVVKVYEV